MLLGGVCNSADIYRAPKPATFLPSRHVRATYLFVDVRQRCPVRVRSLYLALKHLLFYRLFRLRRHLATS